jgi:competence protein ComEC
MRLVRLPWLALAFAVGAGAVELARATVSASLALWLAGAALALVLALESPAVRARMVLALACAGALRMAAARLDVERTPRLPAGVIADDRELDTLVGTVSGPVEELSDQRAFLLGLEDARGPDARVWVTARGARAGKARPVLPGDRVRVRGRLRTPRGYRVPGALDVRRLAAIRDAHLTLATRQVEVLGAEPSPWRWPGRLQRWAAAHVEHPGRGRDATAAAAARAMITGDEGGLDAAGSQRFRDAGVAHVLSVSGLHLAVVALLGFAAVRRAWAAVPALAMRVEPARMGALVAAPVAIGFTMMTGGEVATVRALVVVLVVLAGAATTRRARVIDALGAAGLVILAVQPFALLDPSFQLSFAAAATLALAMRGPQQAAGGASGAGGAGVWPAAWPRARALLRRMMRALRGLAWASLWITLATAPLTALAFGTVPTGGLLANLPVIPLTELVIVPLGILGLGLAAVWSAAGALVLDLAVAASGWVVAIADATAAIAPVLVVPPPNAVELAACGLIWAVAIAGVRGIWPKRTALVVATLGALVLAGSWVVTTWLAPAWRDELRVTFLDVGQGDAAVLELPGGAVWMIDSGGMPFVNDAAKLSPAERQRLAEAPGAQAVVPFLAARRIGRIDIMVISHPHPDHYEGLRAVARAVEIGELWLARAAPGASGEAGQAVGREVGQAHGFAALARELEARGTRIVYPPLDAPVAHRGVVMTALAPRYLDGVASADPVLGVNDNSLVVRVDFAGRMILFAGDIEHEAEALLSARHGRSLRADVVKVPHHGSATSSTARLVHATAPALAVISCGVLNRFGFPDARVVTRWRARGAMVLRTDEAGAITVAITPDGRMRLSTLDWP